MQVAWFVVPKGLGSLLVVLLVLACQFGKRRHLLSSQHPVQGSAGKGRMKKLTSHHEEIIQPQTKKRSGGDEHFSRLPVDGGQEVMTRVRTIIYVASILPPADSHIAHAKALCQYRVQDVGRSGLNLGTGLGCGSRLLMKLDIHLDAL